MKHLLLRSITQCSLLLPVVVVVGCGPGQPAPNTSNRGQPSSISDAADEQHEARSPAVGRVVLPDDQIDSIRRAIDRCAGTLRCDASGQPVEIDLAVGRGSADEAAMEAAVSCPELRILRARAGRVEAGKLAGIHSLAKLEELMLHDAAIDDPFLEGLAENLQELKRLTLRNTPLVTDQGITALSKLPHLTQLALIDLQISGEALNALATCPALTVLDLRMCNNIQGQDLIALVQAPQITELKLGGFGIDDVSIGIVSTLPKLDSLTVEDASIGSDALAELAEDKAMAERIQVLSLARCAGISDESLRLLSELPNLRRLTLRDVPVTGTFLQMLAAPQRLELLSLNQTYLAEEAFQWIAACHNLRRLELAGNYLTPDAIEKIRTLTNLEYLNLTECGLNDEMLDALSTLPRLETLIVEGNPDLSAEVIDRFRP